MKLVERHVINRNHADWREADELAFKSIHLYNRLKQQGIGTLVIGKNEGWKQQVNMGKRNNQKFVNIPHAILIDQLTYKCELAGIKVVIIEESYTSITSAIDLESPGKPSKYAGKRVKRGLFKSGSGRVINADINGSIQIIRKYLKLGVYRRGSSELCRAANTGQSSLKD